MASEQFTKFLTTLDIEEAFKPTDGDILERLARQVAHPHLVFFDVGSWKGYSTAFLGYVAREFSGQVFAVDHWKGSPGIIHHQMVSDCFEIFRYNMNVLGLTDVVLPMVMESRLAAKVIKDETADLVFIDADHRYDWIKADIDAWWPKVRVGGILCGHDCERYYQDCTEEVKVRIEGGLKDDFVNELQCHAGVVKAVYEKFGTDFNIEIPRAIWVKRKE